MCQGNAGRCVETSGRATSGCPRLAAAAAFLLWVARYSSLHPLDDGDNVLKTNAGVPIRDLLLWLYRSRCQHRQARQDKNKPDKDTAVSIREMHAH